MLKPAVLRVNTNGRIHRYPKNWIPKGPRPRSNEKFHSMNNGEAVSPTSPKIMSRLKWPFAPCVCCPDPLELQMEYDHIKKLYQQRVPHNTMERDLLLPWNMGIQVINVYNTVIQSHSQWSETQIPDAAEDGMKHVAKLPRRYQRAASAAANIRKRTKSSHSPMLRRKRLGSASVENINKDVSIAGTVGTAYMSTAGAITGDETEDDAGSVKLVDANRIMNIGIEVNQIRYAWKHTRWLVQMSVYRSGRKRY